MSATLGPGNGGGGGGALPGVGGQTRPGIDDARLDELERLSAKEAIASLDLPNEAGKLDLDPGTMPGPVAEAAYYDDRVVVGLNGPVGSGKTTTMLKSRMRRAMAMPRSAIDGKRRYKLLVIRQTYRHLWSTTIPDFLSVYPKHLGDWTGGRGGPVTFTMEFDDAHGRIEFIAEFMAFGDDVQAAMRGYQATDIWLHEMDTNPEDVMANAITRISRHPGQAHFEGYPDAMKSYGQIVGDFNAPEPDNWVVRLFGIEVDGMASATPDPARVGFHRQPGYGEPGCENLANLPEAYYPNMVAIETARGRSDSVDRLVRNKVVHTRAGEPVFKREWNRQIHVSPTPLAAWPGVPLVIGLDQGFKGAAVIGQRLVEGTGVFRRVRWRILAELHFPEERLLARPFGERLAALLEGPRLAGLRIEAAWGDMAGEHGSSLGADENATWNLLVGRAAGFRVRPQRLGTNRITPRLEAVRAALEAPVRAGEPGIVIDPGCRFLIAGFEARYVWTDEVNANGDKRKVPDKSLTEANVMDALQYLLLSEHRPDGVSTQSFPETQGAGRDPRLGHNGGPPLGEDRDGLSSRYDILNPYGGR